MRYKWIARKPSAKVHICDEDGLALCHMERGASKRSLAGMVRALIFPPGRDVCTMCSNLAERR